MDAGIVIGLVQLGVTVIGGFVLMPMRGDIKDLRDKDDKTHEKFVSKETYNRDHATQEKVNDDLFKRMNKQEVLCGTRHGGTCK
ncbi:MAG: hypothetical protein AB7F25_12440 [Deferribacterales bacterium]